MVAQNKKVTAAAPSESDDGLESLNPDQALFEGKIGALISTLSSDERPLQGLAGLLDWRFEGAISRLLKSGFLTGNPGECAYLPLQRAGVTYHLLLIGMGKHDDTPPGIPQETARALKKNLTTLKLERVGASRSDLGNNLSALKGLSVWPLR
ncbi:M17 family peptidase N-terminal domain-containing protein [Bdellovibrionota bacterium FG-1]